MTASKANQYKRLPGRGFLPFFSQSMWLGKDHLLWVQTILFQQQYKRFYYEDIQTVMLCRTNGHWIWTMVWGALMLIFGSVAMVSSRTLLFFGVMTVLFGLLMVANLALGPSCTVRLQTAVQVQKLSSIRRVRTANKVMDRIKIVVEDIQGRLAVPIDTSAVSAEDGSMEKT